MAEKSADELVLARTALENESACGVPELMHCHPQSGLPVNPLGDLAAEQGVAFGACALPREQQSSFRPRSKTGRKSWTYSSISPSEVLLQGIFQPDPVLDVVIREDEPVVGVRPAGLDQVGSSLIATRLARRTGATVRMAMATASCAVTAAFSGADDAATSPWTSIPGAG